jgi:hypothetical protein
MYSMTSLRKIFFLIVFLWTISACKEEPFFKPLSLPLRQESEHFSFYYDDNFDEVMAEEVKTKLEEEYDGLLQRLRAPELTKVKVAVWSDAEAFSDAQNNRFPGSSGYVYSKEEIRVLHQTHCITTR